VSPPRLSREGEDLDRGAKLTTILVQDGKMRSQDVLEGLRGGGGWGGGDLGGEGGKSVYLTRQER